MLYDKKSRNYYKNRFLEFEPRNKQNQILNSQKQKSKIWSGETKVVKKKNLSL